MTPIIDITAYRAARLMGSGVTRRLIELAEMQALDDEAMRLEALGRELVKRAQAELEAGDAG